MFLGQLWRSQHLISIFLFLVKDIHAAPVEDTGQYEYQSWESAPNKRGSINIVFSCGAAFVICVWTSLHLNVKPIEQSRKESRTLSIFLGKTVWALIGLLAPDLILAIALHQLLIARKYQSYVNRNPGMAKGPETAGNQDITKSKSRKGHKRAMGLKVAYFATMGGFAVEVHNVSGVQKLAVKFPDLNQSAIIDRIHDFPISEVKDKSKATTFAKTVACVQTGWILLQCFGRQYASLHITLLEVNTAVHVIIAILIYAIWWEKPVDISEPIVVQQRGTPHSEVQLQIAQVSYWVRSARGILERGPYNITARSNSGSRNSASNRLGARDDGSSQKLEAILFLCRSLDKDPVSDKAGELVKQFPIFIQKHLAKTTLKDTKYAVLQAYRSPYRTHIHKEISDAAFSAAFREANRTAFRVAPTLIHDRVLQIIEPDAQGSTLDRNEELKQAFDEVRRRTFRVAFRAAFSATETASVKVNHPTDSASATGTKDALLATSWAANAATRATSREAVRLAALSEALGKSISAEVAVRAFRKLVSDECSTMDRKQSSRVQQFIQESISERFYEQFHGTSRTDLGASTEITASYVRLGTSIGIKDAIAKFLDEAKSSAVDHEWRTLFERAKLELANSDDPGSRNALKPSRRKRVKGSLETGGAVLTDQFFAVPYLFGAIPHLLGRPVPLEKALPEAARGEIVRENSGVGPFNRHWRIDHRIVMLTFSALMAAFYSAVHATKWNSQSFATDTERFLWRVSCVVGAMACIPLTFLVFLAWLNDPRRKEPSSPTMRTARFIIALSFFSTAASFMAARTYLVLESLISLRHLPPDAFEAVAWSEAIPHL